MNEMKQPTQTREDGVTQRTFWGTIALDVVTLLLFSYFLNLFLRQDKSLLIWLAVVVFLLSIIASLTSIVLTVRGRQKLGVEITLSALYVMGTATAFIFQGRVGTASLSILVFAIISIIYLLPGQSRRLYSFVTAAAMILMWVVEWINPSWRIQVEAATLGPAAVIVFAVILVVLAARQAWSGNIRVKLITAFTLVALTSLGILGTVTYTNYRNQVREDIRQRLLNIVSITALQQDGDLFATIQTVEDMQGDAYKKMEAVNHAILATDLDLAYIFSVRVDEQGSMVFVVDSGLEEGYVPLEVGVPYDDPSVLLAENTTTLDRAIVEEDFYTDEYGTFLSAYAPIYKKDGTRVGIVGIDIFANKIIEAEQAVLRLILFTTAIAMVLVTLLGLFLGNVFTNPIIHLSQVAQKITAGNLDARAEIETTDEVGELALTLNAMTSQLQGTLQGLEQRVADRTRGLELAAEVGRSVSRVRSLDEMLRDAAEIVRTQFDLYYVQVYLTDASRTNLVLQSGTGKVGEELVGRGHRLPLNTASINGRAAIEKRSVVISDTAASASFRPNPLLPETRSEMAVPLVFGDQVVGVLDLQSAEASALNLDNLPAFEALAGQIAVAIQNANLLEQAEQARAEVETQARRLVRAGWQDYLNAINKPEQAGFAFEKNEVIPLENSEALPSENQADSLAVPISLTGQKIGSLVVDLEQERQTPQIVELVNIVARQVAQQVESLRLLDTAERYRFEAEESARRLTREGWEEYFKAKSGQSLSYLYDLKEVKAREPGDTFDTSAAFSTPIKVRDETIGNLAVVGLDESPDAETLALIHAVSERLSDHIEGLRLLEETQLGQVELTKRARQLAAVSEISTISSRELDIEKMLATVVHLTQRRFGLYHAHVFTYNENSKMLEIVACGYKEGDEHEGTHGTTTIPIDQEQSLVARAARNRAPVVVNDVHSSPDWLPNPLLPDTASELAVPLVIGDEVLGVLDVQSDRLNAFNDEDVSIQSTLAAQVATALQNARSFARAQRQADREAMLNAISQKIQSATSVEAVLQIAARELGHALGAPRTIAQLSMKENK